MTSVAWFDRVRGPFFSLMWALNAALLIAVTLWIFFDPKFPQVVSVQRFDLGVADPTDASPIRDRSMLASRLLLSRAAAIGLAGSTLGLLVGLFIGASRHRRILTWLFLMALTSGWLTLAIQWDNVRWGGQLLRARNHVDRFEGVAASLRNAWPARDGERTEIGPFMAYPRHDPTTLLLLASPQVPNGSLSFSAVERSPSGGLRFQLAGDDRDVWLEWHPEGERPASFVGGLEDYHDLRRFSPVGEKWFLASYQPKS